MIRPGDRETRVRRPGAKGSCMACDTNRCMSPRGRWRPRTHLANRRWMGRAQPQRQHRIGEVVPVDRESGRPRARRDPMPPTAPEHPVGSGRGSRPAVRRHSKATVGPTLRTRATGPSRYRPATLARAPPGRPPTGWTVISSIANGWWQRRVRITHQIDITPWAGGLHDRASAGSDPNSTTTATRISG
jgi:hypothetical protein